MRKQQTVEITISTSQGKEIVLKGVVAAKELEKWLSLEASKGDHILLALLESEVITTIKLSKPTP